jgi:hypothetical protein
MLRFVDPAIDQNKLTRGPMDWLDSSFCDFALVVKQGQMWREARRSWSKSGSSQRRAENALEFSQRSGTAASKQHERLVAGRPMKAGDMVKRNVERRHRNGGCSGLRPRGDTLKKRSVETDGVQCHVKVRRRKWFPLQTMFDTQTLCQAFGTHGGIRVGHNREE